MPHGVIGESIRAHFLIYHQQSPGLPSFLYSNVLSCGENIRTSHGIARVWPSPGKEPRQNVDCAILIAVHDESTVRATVGPFPERHGLQIATPATGFGRVAFI